MTVTFWLGFGAGFLTCLVVLMIGAGFALQWLRVSLDRLDIH